MAHMAGFIIATISHFLSRIVRNSPRFAVPGPLPNYGEQARFALSWLNWV